MTARRESPNQRAEPSELPEHASSRAPGAADSLRQRRPSESPELRDAIAGRLRKARAAAGVTQEEVASSLGRRKSWLAKLERGQRSLLFSEAIDLADAYGIALVDLFPNKPTN